MERQKASRERRARDGGASICGMISAEGAADLEYIMQNEGIPTKIAALEYALQIAAKKSRRKPK